MAKDNVGQNGSGGGGPLDFAKLLELSDLRVEVVKDVPRWACDVEVIEQSAEAVLQMQIDATDKKTNELDRIELMKRLLRASIITVGGKPFVFSREQIDAVFKRSKEPLDAIYTVIASLNKIGEDVEAEAKGNFPGAAQPAESVSVQVGG